MGRYYSGDIDGKFWFAVQSSDSADRFGVCGEKPNYLDYYFSKDDIKGVKKEIEFIKKYIGVVDLKLIKKFFKPKVMSYSEKTLIDFFKENGKEISESDVEVLLREYADLILGEKILKYLKEHGECEFTAEC